MIPNPLTGDLVQVRYRYTRAKGGWVEADGKPVAPGLAIVPRADSNTHKTNRYILVHTVSGFSFGADYCAGHIADAARVTAELTDDWTLGRDDLVAALKARDLVDWSNRTRGCADWCEPGDGPKPPTFEVSCKTCGWERDPDLDGFVTTREQAEEIGRDHECEPWIEITNPAGAVA